MKLRLIKSTLRGYWQSALLVNLCGFCQEQIIL